MPTSKRSLKSHRNRLQIHTAYFIALQFNLDSDLTYSVQPKLLRLRCAALRYSKREPQACAENITSCVQVQVGSKLTPASVSRKSCSANTLRVQLYGTATGARHEDSLWSPDGLALPTSVLLRRPATSRSRPFASHLGTTRRTTCEIAGTGRWFAICSQGASVGTGSNPRNDTVGTPGRNNTPTKPRLVGGSRPETENVDCQLSSTTQHQVHLLPDPRCPEKTRELSLFRLRRFCVVVISTSAVRHTRLRLWPVAITWKASKGTVQLQNRQRSTRA